MSFDLNFLSLSAIVWELIRPSSLLVLGLVVGLGFCRFGKQRLGLFLISGATMGFVAIMVLPVGEWAIGTLEQRFPPVSADFPKVDGIIVLGGAVRPALTEIYHQPALTDGAERMTAFVALARRYPQARLMFVGGSGGRRSGALRESDVARQLFAEMGIDVSHMLFENQSINTWENAVFAKELAKPRPEEAWLLVTSAFHMPRALGCFRKVGWNVIPYPVGFKSERHGLAASWSNLPNELQWLDYAVHEWLGGFVYGLLGRT